MKLAGKTIAILVAEGVEDLEYYVPLMRLQEEDATILSAGLDLKPFKGKNGLVITLHTLIESLRAEDLFALILPSGWAPDKLRRYKIVTNLVRQIDTAEKPLGIIGHGGLIAILAGVVKGRRVTGSLGTKDDLINIGTTWVDESAFRDGRQVLGARGRRYPSLLPGIDGSDNTRVVGILAK